MLNRDKELGVVKELTVSERTWMLLTESPEGGWGIAGRATTNADVADAARSALAGQ